MTVHNILEDVHDLVSGGDWKMVQSGGQFRLYRKGEVTAYCPFTALRREEHGCPEPMIAGFAVGRRLGLSDEEINLVISAADNRSIPEPAFYAVQKTFERFSTLTMPILVS